MSKTKNVMHVWLAKSTIPERKALAKAAKTSLDHLHHIAAGRRGVTAEMAQRIAQASQTLAPRLHIDQRDLCAACGACPIVLAKRRLTKRAA